MAYIALHHHQEFKNEADKPALKSGFFHLANPYIHVYNLSSSTLKMHGILKKLKNDNRIDILGSGIVIVVFILDWALYPKAIKETLNDKIKFKELPYYVTRKGEAELQRFLRTLKNKKKYLHVYWFIYQSGSAPVEVYGTPKIHQRTNSDNFPKL